MVKAKALCSYNDLKLRRLVRKDEVIELSNERFKELSGTCNKAGRMLVKKIATK